VNQGDALLQAIRDNPDDQAHRLVYADWLDERPDNESRLRAEFIRVQCALARVAEPLASWDDWAATAARVTDLRRREQELLRDHADAWSREVRPLVVECEFRRGFVEVVTMPPEQFLDVAERLFRLTPLRVVRFKSGGVGAHVFGRVFSSPHLERLSGLDFSRYPLIPHALVALLASRHTTGITRLVLSGCHLTAASARLIAAAPLLGQLTYLDLRRNNNLGREGMEALAQSRHLTRLRTLLIDGGPFFQPHEAEALTAALDGTTRPELLRVVLGLRQEVRRVLRGRGVAKVGARVRHAGRPEEVLGPLLRDPTQRTRAAAAQVAGALGDRAVPLLPALVQRLFESNATVRSAAAGALAGLLPALPEVLRRWLCILANPVRAAEDNLLTALDSAALPAAVREEFARLCVRRINWRLRHAGHEPSSAAPANPLTAEDALWAAAVQAEEAALRHAGPADDLPRIREAARARESAWLTARLLELLQRHVAEGR
jgi:uncharacterized protein (TIGR02996 family)